jgi:hypothetical protein
MGCNKSKSADISASRERVDATPSRDAHSNANAAPVGISRTNEDQADADYALATSYTDQRLAEEGELFAGILDRTRARMIDIGDAGAAGAAAATATEKSASQKTVNVSRFFVVPQSVHTSEQEAQKGSDVYESVVQQGKNDESVNKALEALRGVRVRPVGELVVKLPDLERGN